jgi:zinc transporter ZupT
VLWIDASHVWVAFEAMIFLMFFHYLSPWFANRLPKKGRSFVSFSGGVAVAYVFLHMLPDLVEYNKPIGAFLIRNAWLTSFTELFIYIVALLGFLVYYGLDLFAERYRDAGHDDVFVYALHLGMFCLYNFLITYTMSLRAQSSMPATCVFTVAMALHFVLTDRKFCRFYTARFKHLGRFLLMLALFFGWLGSVIFDPVNVLVSAFMLAFLAGSILLNVFREELPATRLTNYYWFSFGIICITLTLLLQILLAV